MQFTQTNLFGFLQIIQKLCSELSYRKFKTEHTWLQEPICTRAAWQLAELLGRQGTGECALVLAHKQLRSVSSAQAEGWHFLPVILVTVTAIPQVIEPCKSRVDDKTEEFYPCHKQALKIRTKPHRSLSRCHTQPLASVRFSPAKESSARGGNDRVDGGGNCF